MDWRIAVALDALAWIILGVVVGRYQAGRAPDQLSRTGLFTAMSPREYGGGWYRRVLKVDLWKDRLPVIGHQSVVTARRVRAGRRHRGPI